MREPLLLLFFVTSVLVAQPALSEEGDQQGKDRAAEMLDEAAGDDAQGGLAKKSSGRVIEYSGDTRGGVVEATPHIREAEDLSAKKPDKKSTASAKSKRQKKIEQQNSVKLITGGDPTEGSAKVGRLPVLD